MNSRDKILSAHEREIEVIVRGKAGRETEFGNALFISESSDGFIFDYKLYRRGAPADAVKLTESLERQQAFQIDQPIEEVVGDRAFSDQSDRPRIGRSRNHRLETARRIPPNSNGGWKIPVSAKARSGAARPRRASRS